MEGRSCLARESAGSVRANTAVEKCVGWDDLGRRVPPVLNPRARRFATCDSAEYWDPTAIQVIRNGEIVETIECEETWDFSAGIDVPDLKPGEYVYVRVVQSDRGLAWSSPFCVA